MLLLDTDHISEMLREDPATGVLTTALASSPRPAYLSIITIGELHKGWLAKINTARTARARLVGYARYHALGEALRNWHVLPWSQAADDIFARLVADKVRLGTMDLRIASIALASGATLLSRNTRDFSKVKGLHFENWLD